MPVHNFAFPVEPGKEDLARTFADEVRSERADHYAARSAMIQSKCLCEHSSALG